MDDVLAFFLTNAVNVVIGIVIGLATGVVSGLAVARAARFNAIKQDAHRMARNFEYLCDGEAVEILHHIEVRAFRDLASDLFFLQHREAGLALLAIANDIQSIQTRDRLSLTRDEVVEFNGRAQPHIRALKPNWRAIIFSGPI